MGWIPGRPRLLAVVATKLPNNCSRHHSHTSTCPGTTSQLRITVTYKEKCTIQGQSGSITLSACRTTQLMELSTLDKQQSTTNRGRMKAENGTPGSITFTPARTVCLSSSTNLNLGDRLSLTEGKI